MSYLLKYLLAAHLVLFTLPGTAYSLGVDTLLMGVENASAQTTPAVTEVPDPAALKLNWWEYFEVKTPQEFTQRVNSTLQLLNSQLSRLNGEEQEEAKALINTITMNLNAIQSLKQQPALEAPIPQPFLQNYTIEQQIDLNRKIRLATLEKKAEEEELDHLKERVDRMQKHLDNILVPYLAQSTPTIEKMLVGLEIISNKAALVSSYEQLKLSHKRLDIQKIKLSLLQKELDASHDLLDFKNFNPNKLEADIRAAEMEWNKAQAELSKVESSSPVNISQNSNERNSRHLLNQKLIHTHALRSLAWTRLEFHKLKYNLYMHLNNQFSDSHSHKDIHDELQKLNEQLDKTEHHAQEWKKGALREQDRIQQEYAASLTRQETIDNKQSKLNQARRQESIETLSTLQLLENEIFNTRWVVSQMDNYIRTHSSFWEVSWINISTTFEKAWDTVYDGLNFTLFKIGELPITSFSLARMAAIITLFFFLSKLLRTTLLTFGNRRGNVTASTLYTLGRLLHYITLMIGVLLALVSIGFDFSNLVLVASALTLGIGFGLQSFANNFICGLRILFERNLKIGDYIELHSGTYGKVTEIHVQNTVICTSDGTEIVIPNSELANQTLINYTMNNDFRRLSITFSVSSEADKNLVRKVIGEAAKRVPCTAPATKYGTPQVWLKSFDKHCLEFCLAVWVNYKAKSFTDSKESDYLWEIETALRENKVPLTSSHSTFLISDEEHGSVGAVLG